jgi:hypothetical protein
MLAENKLDDTGSEIEHSSQKFHRHLAHEIQVWRFGFHVHVLRRSSSLFTEVQGMVLQHLPWSWLSFVCDLLQWGLLIAIWERLMGKLMCLLRQLNNLYHKWGYLHNSNIYKCKQRQVDTNVSWFFHCAKVFRYMFQPSRGHHQAYLQNFSLSSWIVF